MNAVTCRTVACREACSGSDRGSLGLMQCSRDYSSGVTCVGLIRSAQLWHYHVSYQNFISAPAFLQLTQAEGTRAERCEDRARQLFWQILIFATDLNTKGSARLQSCKIQSYDALPLCASKCTREDGLMGMPSQIGPYTALPPGCTSIDQAVRCADLAAPCTCHLCNHLRVQYEPFAHTTHAPCIAHAPYSGVPHGCRSSWSVAYAYTFDL